jgi:ribonuclease J
VIYDSLAPIHVSGHASQEELKLLLNMVKPKHFIPIHGELRQLKRHGKLAVEVGIPEENVIIVENGQIVELAGKNIKLGERIPGGYVFVDGQSIGEVDFSVMREREKLARNGIFLIDISVDKNSGKLLHEPEIITRGFVSQEDAEELLPEVRQHIMDVVNNSSWDSEKDIANTVKSYLYEYTKRRPMVLVTLSKG